MYISLSKKCPGIATATNIQVSGLWTRSCT